MLLKKYTDRETGQVVLKLSASMDQERNESTVVYCPDDNENTIFTMDLSTFIRRFDPC